MKKLLFVLLTSVTCSAQLPMVNGKVVYTEVVLVDSASAMDLYRAGKHFFSSTFNSGKDVIHFDDQQSFQIEGKAFTEVYIEYSSFLGSGSVKNKLWYTIRLSFKEGRYKYEITNFYFESYPTATYPQAVQNSLENTINDPGWKATRSSRDNQRERLSEAKRVADGLIKNIKASIQRPTASESDW